MSIIVVAITIATIADFSSQQRNYEKGGQLYLRYPFENSNIS